MEVNRDRISQKSRDVELSLSTILMIVGEYYEQP